MCLLGLNGTNFPDLLVDGLNDMSFQPKELFRVNYNPNLMFNFNKFKTLFAKEIIPTQISLYEAYVIYNPVQLTFFGNP